MNESEWKQKCISVESVEAFLASRGLAVGMFDIELMVLEMELQKRWDVYDPFTRKHLYFSNEESAWTVIAESLAEIARDKKYSYVVSLKENISYRTGYSTYFQRVTLRASGLRLKSSKDTK